MGKVILLAEKREESCPHVSGEAICAACKHKWVAVCPIPIVQMGCPECHAMRGYFIWPIEEGEGTEVFVCNFCGGTVFSILRDGYRCLGCASRHSFETVADG